jgi:hypothetical protein
MARPTIFISHMHIDEQSANALEIVLRKALLGGLDVFNSSNRRSISAGDPWRDKIIDTLKKSKCVLILASPESVSSPWVNFEAGGAWVSNTRVIPCCIKGMTPSSLPAPLSHLQAINLESPEDIRVLVKHLAEVAQLDFPEEFDFEDALTVLTESWEKSVNTANDELLLLIAKARRRPEKYKGQTATGFFRVEHLSATDRQETRQFPRDGLKAGDSINCWLTIEGEQYKKEYHCFAMGTVADMLEESIEGSLFHGRIKCLGQMKVYETDINLGDEERGISYPAAWLIVEAVKV